MANAEQIKALIRTHFSEGSERFYSIALQIAAHEAMQGHTALANDIKEIIEAERRKKGPKVTTFPENLRGLVLTEEPSEAKEMFVAPDILKERIERIVTEYRQQNRLKSHGLKHRRKVLLIGPSGTGKTMTAKVIAHELKLSLHSIQVDRLVTKFMGETGAKLRQIFDLVRQEHGVYLFDEFDAIGSERSLDNDVGEIRRVLNSFLQFIENDTSDSIIIAATNNPKLLDHALYRRFDDVLYYEKPSKKEIKRLTKNSLAIFIGSCYRWEMIVDESQILSQAEIVAACKDAVKKAILTDSKTVTDAVLLDSLVERRNSYTKLRS